MSSNTLEIIQGLAQAAANGYDGAHDERYSLDGEVHKTGLKREEGDPILDKRVNDGFAVRFSANTICITYQSDVPLKSAADPKFEQDVERMINEVKKFLQKEYKKITGKGVTLSKQGEPIINFISLSRVRSFVKAHQYYKISGVDAEPIFDTTRSSENDVMKKFLAQHSTKRPRNEKIKKGANNK